MCTEEKEYLHCLMCHLIFSEFAKIKDEVPNMIMDAHMGRVKEASERGESDSVANSIEKSGIAGTEKVNFDLIEINPFFMQISKKCTDLSLFE